MSNTQENSKECRNCFCIENIGMAHCDCKCHIPQEKEEFSQLKVDVKAEGNGSVRINPPRIDSTESFEEKFMDKFCYEIERSGMADDRIEEMFSFISSEREKVRQEERERIVKIINKVSLSNEDLTIYGDGFERAIKNIRNLINNKQ